MRRLRAAAVAVAVVALLVVAPQPAYSAYIPKTPTLSTPWIPQVSPANPLPEYPRPQLAWHLTPAWDPQ